MEAPCVLEVDVNGEEKFFVDKKILSAFSGRVCKSFGKSLVAGAAKTWKLLFHDLPGGPVAFELVARFCYDNGNVQITPTNTCLLYFVARFMEMNEEISSTPNLIEKTESSLEGIHCWTWSEMLTALKQCQDCFVAANSSGVLDKILDSIVGRILTASETSPSGSSPESSAIRFSFDTKSTMSTKNGYHRSWWFDDLLVLNSKAIEKAAKCMVLKKLDHATISRFLFYYLKNRYLNATVDEKRRDSEIVIDLLYSLGKTTVACKGLYGILRVSSSLNLSKRCTSKLESMIGNQIDQVTLDNLLVPAPNGTESLYDVNLVLRFLKHFLRGGCPISVARLKRVGSLMDSYIAEVAPDPSLKPSKFASIIAALPDAARDTHDAMYRAIDMYIEVHSQLSEDEKMKICCAINYEKLSSESCKHLARNSKFPSRSAIQALVSQQSKLKSLLQETNHLRKFSRSQRENQSDDAEQVILYAKKLDFSVENEKLKAHLQGMRWKVMELEKICRKMQIQVAKMTKSKLSSPSGARSLPKLCS